MVNPVLGRWRIREASLWEREDVDLMGPAFIEFRKDGTGSFQVVAMTGEVDHRVRRTDEGWEVEFSWAGDDDGSEASGRGRLRLHGSLLKGDFFIHYGDDAQIEASRE